ncbi:hypothetical protein [Sphingomonas carotinifaciens]|uniref:ATP-binding protein n=1 Tax=Sphingomonas carotinifaciens TaxID=1166323 RepID=A0A1G7PRG1_9SPHN|nr:hypothetical protein [Sphingomonas carotinifaciens]MBB4087629.1 hypothetical protein [Sphingomonas carotinifaciens]MWC45713.1 hypothetical protein [Sphingomonas carotinifaciens]SDF88000.1 hypothetical protein SAMN05216557_10717 [Sphingomonas carotinifaciens]
MRNRAPTRIADYMGSPGPFYRSVAIERDRDDAAAMRGYVLTPWLKRVAAEILEGLLPGSRRRAWRVTGDFGVGKSALALALLRTLDPRCADAKAPMDRFAKTIGSHMPRMYPLVLSGKQAGLNAGMAAAIANTVERERDLLDAKARRALTAVDPFEAILLLRDALIRSGRYDGLLVVIDEMGKFLEAAAIDPDQADIFRLQELAELAARSGERPLAVLMILHQGLQSYHREGAVSTRSEWAKVAERYDELVFDHPLSHTAALLSAALSPDMRRLPAAVRKSYAEAESAAGALGWLGPRGEGGEPCYPLHPAAVPAIARFFSAYGQNERSLFGFAASGEPNSLRAFADRHAAEDGLYGLDRFFDYVSTSFGHRLVARGGAGDWERIRTVLDGSAGSDPTEVAILKTVGVLNLIDAPDMVADVTTIQACLAPGVEPAAVARAITGLRERGVLFERVGRAGLRLWTSHRVDLSALWSEADAALPQASIGGELSKALSSIPIRPFLLARRHSVETGVTRRFPIRMVPASSLATTTLTADADGRILAVLCDDADEVAHAAAWAEEATAEDPTLLVLTLPPRPELRSNVVDLLRHRWIEANASILREDVFASAEIERRIKELESRLIDRLEGSLGLAGDPPAPFVRVFRGGRALADTPALHLLVSSTCDELYGAGPLVHNELINRHALTSAGAAARQRLIEALFERTHEPDLSFTGNKNPPERSLYLSLLKLGGVHRERDGVFVVDLPEQGDDPLRLRPALERMREQIRTAAGRVAVTEIYSCVSARPFGVRAALAPLLLAIVMVADRHRMALFERGTYCPKLDAQAFMRILKSPENFTIQWVALEGVRAEVYQRLAATLGSVDGEDGLMAVVAPLVRFGAGLSLHAQRSAEVSPNAARVRDAIMRARSPVDLVFTELPAACGLEPFDGDGEDGAVRAAEFAERLADAIGELERCYPSLLDRMRSEVGRALGADGDLRTNVADRAGPLVFRVKAQALRTFVQRLADRVLSDDAWIEAMGGALVGKPPSRWLSPDVATWQGRLEDISATFLRLEAAAFGSEPEQKGVVRLALTHVDGREHVSIVGVNEQSPEEELFTRSILHLIERNGASIAQVVARLAGHMLEANADEGTQTARSEGA